MVKSNIERGKCLAATREVEAAFLLELKGRSVMDRMEWEHQNPEPRQEYTEEMLIAEGFKEDPKKEAGDKKAPLHLLPTVGLREEAYVLQLGATKYGVYNWRKSDGVNTSTYSAAIMRHITQFMDGEDVDEESGRSHLAHIKATCAILLDADSVGKLIDDRNKSLPQIELEKASNEQFDPDFDEIVARMQS